MADFKTITDLINSKIVTNGEGLIDAITLRDILLGMLTAVGTNLDLKVDTETGKGLSTNDLTNARLAQINSIDGKVDKVQGKSLILDTLITKLSNMPYITEYDYANHRVTLSDGTHSQVYQLTPYVPIPDFYAFFGNVKYTEGAWNFQTNGGSWKTFSALTAEDLMAVATAQGEGGGNMIKTTAQKITLPTKNHGSVKCDYVKNDYNGGGNALLILSKSNVTLDFTIITSALESHYIYNRSQTVDQFNHNMDKSNLEIGTGKYNLRVYKATSGTLDGNSFGINYNN